VKYCFFLCYQ
jgi:cathepsin L